jgi:insulysin
MKKSGYQKHVFSELKSMASLNEIYSSKGEGMYRAIGLANEALWFPTEDVGRISYIYTNDSSEPFEKLVQSLNVNTMLTMLIAKGVETDQVEHFYNAPYSYHEDENFYKELLKTKKREQFRIPKPNPFIPKKASVPKRELKDGVVPTQIEGNKGESLYFGQDHEFLRPKGAISLKILFPKDIMSPEHRAFSRIYAACVNESLNELSYPAKLAGLNYSIKEGYEGIYVDVSGYKESSLRLYELMLEHMTDFKITQSQFEAIKDKIVRDYENLALSDAYMETGAPYRQKSNI